MARVAGPKERDDFQIGPTFRTEGTKNYAHQQIQREEGYRRVGCNRVASWRLPFSVWMAILCSGPGKGGYPIAGVLHGQHVGCCDSACDGPQIVGDEGSGGVIVRQLRLSRV